MAPVLRPAREGATGTLQVRQRCLAMERQLFLAKRSFSP
jgi:hypothetical protein